MKAIVFLLLCVVSANCQVPSAKVTFFREDQSMLKQMGEFKKDYAGAGVNWSIYMDGIKMVKLHRDRMVTFSIPPGIHYFKTNRSVLVTVDVKPGSNIFMRPRFDTKKHGLVAVNIFEVVSCSNYAERTKDIKQVKPSDIFTGGVVTVDQFTDICGAK
jgi:hypothetical protein